MGVTNECKHKWITGNVTVRVGVPHIVTTCIICFEPLLVKFSTESVLRVEHPKWHKNVNIDWGAGKVARGRWMRMKRLIREHNVESVLEFGSGLSTEMLSMEDVELWSCDTLEWHVERMKRAMPFVHFIHYEKGVMPEIDRKFDMVFVDGPAGDRSGELSLANKVATKVIFCDDWGRGQDTVKMDPKWEVTIRGGSVEFILKEVFGI